jgi:hypothetical protein
MLEKYEKREMKLSTWDALNNRLKIRPGDVL